MRKWPWVIFFICVILDLVLATWTWQEVRESIGWVKHIPQKTDFKIRHIIQYAPQAFLLGLCLDQYQISAPKKTLFAILGVTSIGIVTELIQAFIPSRIPAFLDVFWNFTAACIGAIIYYFFQLKISKNKSNLL